MIKLDQDKQVCSEIEQIFGEAGDDSPSCQ